MPTPATADTRPEAAAVAHTRASAIRALRERTHDVLVVGGGIIGAGIARDLALRGFSVALVEQHDLASGTTSRPTRLIHGGLRYLEMLDFGLVREDMRERELLLRMAPHLVTPLPFLLPLYGRSLVYQAKLRAGMLLYDLLSYDKSLPGRQLLSREQVLEIEPTLNPVGLQGAWRFFDAQVAHVERLVVENALDAAGHGAVVLNHAKVTGLLREPGPRGRVLGVRVRDGVGGHELEARASLVVNASGPWLDLTSSALREGERPLLRLTKGVHLVTPRSNRQAHVLFARGDGRLFFVVPWLDRSLVGTTDTDYRGDPADAAASEADVRYLQTEAQRVFPQGKFDEVYYTWAGVRALVRVEGVREGRVSRKHRLHDHEARDGVPGVLSVVGGKITGYRGIAQEVGELVSRALRPGQPVAPSPTAGRPLPGGRLESVARFVEEELLPRAADLGLRREQVAHLPALYGSLSPRILGLVEQERALAEPLCPHEPTLLAELAYATRDEWAVGLSDALLRRTGFALRGGHTTSCFQTTADRLGELLGWDATEREAQLAAYFRETEPMFRFSTVPRSEAAPAPSPL